MFERSLQIIDEKTLQKITQKNILLVGIGGVGGFAFECLIRLGFIHITVVDKDTFEETNLNRQILSTKKNLNAKKVEEAKKRGLEINPNIIITTHQIFLNEENIDLLFNKKYDYIIDACDTITTKYLLIKKAREENCKIISCLGTGNRLNPNEVKETTLNKTYNDPLAKKMRDILRKNNIPLNNIPVIWSQELPIKTKTRKPGSLILVPATAGLLIAHFILKDILHN